MSPPVSYNEEEFKCCLFQLPGFGKPPKTVRAACRKEEEEHLEPDIDGIVMSKRVSLEKFECGSWRSSSPIIKSQEDQDNSLFFDLPIELIRCSSTVNDSESPVTTAFLFDSNNHHHHPKGVLKNTTSTITTAQQRKSHNSSNSSSRHVHFSSSSPTSPTSSCITPRLRKARDEFNAFLEAAQTA